ncbi:MAG: hypothetical protein L6408_00335 [Nanoarchaeota archaeon]|nr:hypothetical protein [Nanoarchaeota archaeon]
MPSEKVTNLIGELFQLLAKYEVKDFEAAARIVSHQTTTKGVKSLALALSQIKRGGGNHFREPKKEKSKSEGEQLRLVPSIDVNEFKSFLQKTIEDKRRFGTTMAVRLFLEQLFGTTVGKTKDSRERIIAKAINIFKESPDKERKRLSERLKELSSKISSDFEGYYRIIRRSENASDPQSKHTK